MTETLVTTAEAELERLLALLGDGCPRTGDEIATWVRNRLTTIQGGYDGWRTRCLAAEKLNDRLIKELRAVRDDLMTLQNAPPDPAAYYAAGEADGR